MNEEKRLSTTQLAKLQGISQEKMFENLTSQGYIEKKDDKWQLTLSLLLMRTPPHQLGYQAILESLKVNMSKWQKKLLKH